MAAQTFPSSIVVGTDFTPCSGFALAQAIRIGAWAGARLHVVHIIDTLVVVELEEALSPMQTGIRESLIQDAGKAWMEFAQSIPGAKDLPIEVSINNRIVGVTRRATEVGADLIVIGAFGASAPDVGIGTVATACVRKSPVDVLLVRDTPADRGSSPFKTVVAAVDFSETSKRVVERAALIAAHDRAALHLLHVFQPPWRQLHYRSSTPEASPHFQKQYRDGLERRLAESYRPILDAHPGIDTRTSLHEYEGHRSGIVEYALSVSADLIVLGTRGRSSIRDLLLGSTAEKALEESRCSILAVKPPSKT